jgi:hypothetical protein
MKNLIIVLLLMFTTPAIAEEFVYEGPWYTGVTEEGVPTGRRKLQGRMTANIKRTGKDTWEGRFHGIWHGVKFSYVVKFKGPPNKLKGKAVIDGASYSWSGIMGQQSPGWFNGNFDGSRYDGYFKLKEKKKTKG